MKLFLILIAAYLLGSFPSSIVIGKLFFHIDIRDYGSGNAGGTNAVRVFGKTAGIAVILLDVGKGAAAVLLAGELARIFEVELLWSSEDILELSAGIAAVLGHIWTIFASFRGGKGVATAAGMLLAIYPAAVGISALIFVLVVWISGIVSLGSMITAICFPPVLFLLKQLGFSDTSDFLLVASIPIALLILFTHRRNIGRLLRGEEKRIFGSDKRGEKRPKKHST